MAYGKSRNAKKTDLGLFILELLAKIKKKWKKLPFFADFFISKIYINKTKSGKLFF